MLVVTGKKELADDKAVLLGNAHHGLCLLKLEARCTLCKTRGKWVLVRLLIKALPVSVVDYQNLCCSLFCVFSLGGISNKINVFHAFHCRLLCRSALLYLKNSPRSLWNSAEFRLSVGGLEAQGYAAQPTRFQVIRTRGAQFMCDWLKRLLVRPVRLLCLRRAGLFCSALAHFVLHCGVFFGRRKGKKAVRLRGSKTFLDVGGIHLFLKRIQRSRRDQGRCCINIFSIVVCIFCCIGCNMYFIFIITFSFTEFRTQDKFF